MKHITLAAIGVLFATLTVVVVGSWQDSTVTGLVPAPVIITENTAPGTVTIEELNTRTGQN
jgi:hypothetical protein